MINPGNYQYQSIIQSAEYMSSPTAIKHINEKPLSMWSSDMIQEMHNEACSKVSTAQNLSVVIVKYLHPSVSLSTFLIWLIKHKPHIATEALTVTGKNEAEGLDKTVAMFCYSNWWLTTEVGVQLEKTVCYISKDCQKLFFLKEGIINIT